MEHMSTLVGTAFKKRISNPHTFTLLTFPLSPGWGLRLKLYSTLGSNLSTVWVQRQKQAAPLTGPGRSPRQPSVEDGSPAFLPGSCRPHLGLWEQVLWGQSLCMLFLDGSNASSTPEVSSNKLK